jgi:hypothetical protein
MLSLVAVGRRWSTTSSHRMRKMVSDNKLGMLQSIKIARPGNVEKLAGHNP